jgi:transmembrane serine protease 9
MLTMVRPLPPHVVDFLRKSQCGFSGNSPLVCCPLASVSTSPPTADTPIDASNNSNLRLLPLNICGPVFDDKITNGNKTALFQYPWMALIGYNRGN